VNEADIGKIRSRPEMPARFTVDAYPGETFYGKVTEVRLNAQMTQNVVLYTVVVTFDNSDLKVIPYLTANLQFEVEQRKNVLLVPNIALRWKPRKEQIAPDIRDSVAGVSSGKGGGKRSGKGGDRETPAGQEGGKEASPGPADGQQTQPGRGTGSEARPSAKPSEDAKSAKHAKPSKSAKGPRDQQERGRLWVKDGNFVRPVNVQIGVTDGNSTEVSGSDLAEEMEVVVGEARNDQAGDDVTNPFTPKLFRGGRQQQKPKDQ
jgi:HlyD family secretion protein